MGEQIWFFFLIFDYLQISISIYCSRMNRSNDSRDQQYHQSYRGRDRNDERPYRRGPPRHSNRHEHNVQYDDQPTGFSSKKTIQ